MSNQLDLFASEAPIDAYHVTMQRVASPVLHRELTPSVGCAIMPLAVDVRHDEAPLHRQPAPSNADLLPAVLRRPTRVGGGTTPLLTFDGQFVSVPAKWDWEARRDTFQHLLAQAVGAPVSWRRITSPRGTELDARRSGSLYLVGGSSRDLIVRLNSGAEPDGRQSRVSLHVNRRTLDELRQYRCAYQAVVTRVRHPGRVDLLVTATIPFMVLEPLVVDALATAPGGRVALSLEVTCTSRGLTLRVPEADLDVSRYAGVETLASELRSDPGEPWRTLQHPDWMAIVAAVLTLRDGLHC